MTNHTPAEFQSQSDNRSGQSIAKSLSANRITQFFLQVYQRNVGGIEHLFSTIKKYIVDRDENKYSSLSVAKVW